MALPIKVQLPPPGDQNDFENLCEDIAKEYWKDQTAERYGNQGHEQFGIDILSALAKEGGEKRTFAIQCKKKKISTGRKLSKTDINTSLKKAETFSPPLSKLVFATTSPKDPNIQSYIAKINISRDTEGKFPLSVWFWEDIEKILIEKCPQTYLEFLLKIFPENSLDIVNKDLFIEVLRLAEELAKDNYFEKAEGIISVFDTTLRDSNDPKIKIIADRIRARLLIGKEKIDEAITLLQQITNEHKTDIESLALLFHKHIENGDNLEAKKALDLLLELNQTHPLTRNAELIFKIHDRQILEYPKSELQGPDRDKALAYVAYHLFSHQMGDKQKRDYFLSKQKSITPNASSPICFEIIYKLWDLFENLNLATFGEFQVTKNFVLEKEKELETRNPITPNHQLNIVFEKFRLEFFIQKNFSPRHKIPSNLLDDLITKICKSYFNNHIYHRLLDLLSLKPLNKKELSRIIEYLYNSNKKVPSDLSHLILAQALLNDSTLEFANEITQKLQLRSVEKFIKAIDAGDADELISYLKTIQENLIHPLIASIPDYELALNLINGLGPFEDEQTKNSLSHLKIFCLLQKNEDKSLAEIKKEMEPEKEGFPLLNEIANYAESKGQWGLLVECLRNMLQFDTPRKEKVEIESRLAIALFKIEDYMGVVDLKDKILPNIDDLSSENQKVAIKVLSLGAIKAQQLIIANEILTDKFSYIEDSIEFYLYKAQVELKLEQFEESLTTLLEGFRKQTFISRDIYLACYMPLNELSNAGLIGNENKILVENEVYIKISGIDSWFYIGEHKEIDAVKLKPTDTRYESLWGKSLSSQIDWPQDQYQENPATRTIENILTEPTYLKFRAQENMEKEALEGSSHVWGINSEDPEQIVENMKRFWKQIEKKSEDFFENYSNNPIPFAFLINIEGSIANSISKLYMKNRGFIRINDGTIATENQQQKIAKEILAGKPAFIDAISLLFLINADLLNVVCENINSIYYTPSVVACIREHASNYAQSRFQRGRISFGENMEVHLSEYDHQKELEIKNKILEAVEIFEGYALKETDDFLASKLIDIELKLPSGITDPYSAARLKKIDIISDDYFYHRALELFSGKNQPSPTSSLAIIKSLKTEGEISEDSYLNYVSQLLNNRCKHILISAETIYNAILVKNSSQVVAIKPENVRKLHLDLTLSPQYGVSPELYLTIVSSFLQLLINDSTLTYDSYREILAEFLVAVLKNRDKNVGRSLLAMCREGVVESGIVIPISDKKGRFEILKSQIENYFFEFNPLYETIPLMLARGSK